ncbi:MAG: hypothetical protein Q4F88_03650 [Eubacteriales bacterium]|nr:hypothetical protein [Eubacteriales bacterium]
MKKILDIFKKYGKDVSYNKVFYEEGIIQNGYNEYFVKLKCLGNAETSSVLRIGLVQHIDGKNNSIGGVWMGKNNTIYPIGDNNSDEFEEQVFKKKTYMNSDISLFYVLTTIKIAEISSGEKLITKLFKKLIILDDFFEEIGVKMIKSLYDNIKEVIEGTNPLIIGISETLESLFNYGFRYVVDYEMFKKSICDEIGFNSYINSKGEEIYEVFGGLIIGEKEVDIYNQNLFKYKQNCQRWSTYDYMSGQFGAKGIFK